MDRLKILSVLLKSLNDLGYYHNDVSETNVMFLLDKRIFLIDFAKMTIGSRYEFYGRYIDDMKCLNNVVENTISIGLLNHEIYLYYRDQGYITGDLLENYETLYDRAIKIIHKVKFVKV